MIPITLEAISESLKKVGFETHIQPKTEQVPSDILLVPVGSDDQGKMFMLQIQHADQQIAVDLGQKKEDSNRPLSFTTFLLGIPYEIPDDIKMDVMRMLLIANKALPLQGLGYSEPEKSAYFLFSYPSNEMEFSEDTLYGIIGTVGFVVDNIAPVVRDLSEKKTTVEKLLAEKAD